MVSRWHRNCPLGHLIARCTEPVSDRRVRGSALATIGWASGRRTNRAFTWHQRRSPSRGSIFVLCAVNGTVGGADRRYWVCGANGAAALSTDSGRATPCVTTAVRGGRGFTTVRWRHPQPHTADCARAAHRHYHCWRRRRVRDCHASKAVIIDVSNFQKIIKWS